MDAASRQKALDSITPEELEKVKAHQAKTSGVPVDNEWLLMAEFGMLFGWEAYKAARDDEIDSNEMATLITAGRKVKAKDTLDNAQTAFIGSASAQSKKPAQTFKSLVNPIIKQTKADVE